MYCIMWFQSSAELQKLEEERIHQLQDLLNKYNNHRSTIGPKLIKVSGPRITQTTGSNTCTCTCDVYSFPLRTDCRLLVQWSLYFKTTHGTKKMWSYIADGLKMKVI